MSNSELKELYALLRAHLDWYEGKWLPSAGGEKQLIEATRAALLKARGE